MKLQVVSELLNQNERGKETRLLNKALCCGIIVWRLPLLLTFMILIWTLNILNGRLLEIIFFVLCKCLQSASDRYELFFFRLTIFSNYYFLLSLLLFLFSMANAFPYVLQVALTEWRYVPVLSVSACPPANLLDRIIVKSASLPSSKSLLNGAEDHSLNVQVEAHAHRISGHKELNVCQAVIEHVGLRLLGLRRKRSVDYCTVIGVIA